MDQAILLRRHDPRQLTVINLIWSYIDRGKRGRIYMIPIAKNKTIAHSILLYTKRHGTLAEMLNNKYMYECIEYSKIQKSLKCKS